MKIKSTLAFNTKLAAEHKAVGKTAKSNAALLVGSSLPEILRIPAGATLDLSDKEWSKFEKAAASMVKSGDLVIVAAPKLSEEEQAAADEARLKELQAEAEAIMGRQESEKAPAKAPEKAAK